MWMLSTQHTSTTHPPLTQYVDSKNNEIKVWVHQHSTSSAYEIFICCGQINILWGRWVRLLSLFTVATIEAKMFIKNIILINANDAHINWPSTGELWRKLSQINSTRNQNFEIDNFVMWCTRDATLPVRRSVCKYSIMWENYQLFMLGRRMFRH